MPSNSSSGFYLTSIVGIGGFSLLIFLFRRVYFRWLLSPVIFGRGILVVILLRYAANLGYNLLFRLWIEKALLTFRYLDKAVLCRLRIDKPAIFAEPVG